MPPPLRGDGEKGCQSLQNVRIRKSGFEENVDLSYSHSTSHLKNGFLSTHILTHNFFLSFFFLIVVDFVIH